MDFDKQEKELAGYRSRVSRVTGHDASYWAISADKWDGFKWA